ncbi:MAG: hypothetical protein WC505_06960 [Patescibacteria group bacterium]
MMTGVIIPSAFGVCSGSEAGEGVSFCAVGSMIRDIGFLSVVGIALPAAGIQRQN